MKTISLAERKKAAQLGHIINGKFSQWGVPRLFGISVDGYQLLARLARWDDLCWI
jgi:hypothetical protein